MVLFCINTIRQTSYYNMAYDFLFTSYKKINKTCSDFSLESSLFVKVRQTHLVCINKFETF